MEIPVFVPLDPFSTLIPVDNAQVEAQLTQHLIFASAKMDFHMTLTITDVMLTVHQDIFSMETLVFAHQVLFNTRIPADNAPVEVQPIPHLTLAFVKMVILMTSLTIGAIITVASMKSYLATLVYALSISTDTTTHVDNAPAVPILITHKTLASAQCLGKHST